MRYEAVYRNLTFKQAQAMYCLALDLEDDEPMLGYEGRDVERSYPGCSRRSPCHYARAAYNHDPTHEG